MIPTWRFQLRLWSPFLGAFGLLFLINGLHGDHGQWWGYPPSSGEDPEVCSARCSGHPRAGRMGTTGYCTHGPASLLPPSLVGDQGLYGEAIQLLKAGGSLREQGGQQRYGLMNLLIFVGLLPALTLALWAVILLQSDALKLRRAEREADEP